MSTATASQTTDHQETAQTDIRKKANYRKWGKLAALARAEWLQFRRNKVIMFMAILLPLGVPALVLSSLLFNDAEPSATGGAVTTELYLMLGLVFVLFYSTLSMVTTRRDEGVLKRLRTGEAKDWQILAAIGVPGTLIVVALFFVLIVAMVIMGVPMPENPVAMLIALVGGVMCTMFFALITSGFTKNAEAAQLTSMPVLLLGMLSASSFRELLPEAVRVFAEKNPFGIVYDLVYLGWAGNYPAEVMAEAGSLDTGELWTAIAKLTALFVIWILVLAWCSREYMRWDTHR